MVNTKIWLNPENAIDVTKDSAKEIINLCNSRKPVQPIRDSGEAVFRGTLNATSAVTTATRQVATNPFVAAICIEDNEGKETIFISQFLGAGSVQHDSISLSSWTSPIGNLFIHVKNRRLNQEVVTSGLLMKNTVSIGAVADIKLCNGHDVNYLDLINNGPNIVHLPTEEERTTVSEIQAEGFGLRAIVTKVDLHQNYQIRDKLDSSVIITGPPGVGKTTVALHRVAYLINEQNRIIEENNLPKNRAIFRVESILVLVRKEHLVPYLSTNLREELGIFGVSVRTYDSMIRSLLEQYCPSSQLPLTEVAYDKTLNEIRKGVTRGAIRQYLGELSKTEEFLNFTPTKAVAESIERLIGLSIEFNNKEFVNSLSTTNRDNIAQKCDDFRNQLKNISVNTTDCISLNRILNDITKNLEIFRSEVKNVIDNISLTGERKKDYEKAVQAFNSGLSTLRLSLNRSTKASFDYRSILVLVYRKHLELLDIGDSDRSRINQLLKDNLDSPRKEISASDWLTIMYIVEIITSGSDVETGICGRLQEFSHIVMDESQFLQTDQINFLIGRVQKQKGSFTIVGDLNQKIDKKTGQFLWENVMVGNAPVEVKVLNKVYRPTAQIYDFLELFAQSTGIDSEFSRPLNQNDGDKPVIIRYDNEKEYCKNISKYIWDVRCNERGSSFCMVMSDPDANKDLIKSLTEETGSYGIKLKESYGEDISESTEKLVLTDYESIVGLEFDNVIVHIDGGIADRNSESYNRNSLWVALSRARRRLVISAPSTEDSLFDAEIFDKYRVN